jgi:alkaline phosphatase
LLRTRRCGRKQNGEPLKTILEYAEEHGLSTGVVTNGAVLSATPAACYAHVNDRDDDPEILRQLLAPRFGDGVDVVIGGGRTSVLKAAEANGLVARDALAAKGCRGSSPWRACRVTRGARWCSSTVSSTSAPPRRRPSTCCRETRTGIF